MRTHSNKFAQRIGIALAAVAGVFALSGCTKSFCTNQDKANQLYAYYGDIYEEQAVPEKPDPADQERGYNNQVQHRKELYATLTSGSYDGATANNAYGYTLPNKEFQSFMSAKVDAFVVANSHLWSDGSLASLSADEAGSVAKHVAIYAGLTTTNEVAEVWTNLDIWYSEAVQTLSYEVVPPSGYIEALKKVGSSAITSNYACISPTSETYMQDGSSIYIEGKTWGQAFKQYGFLEGLFVYPFAWIIHSITSMNRDSGWSQILAIFCVTLLVRLVTVIAQIFQNRSQEKTQALQPQINALRAKYPNLDTDKEQSRAFAMEQAALMRKSKSHPFLPMLFLILQWPLFLCIWSALQGSAALASGSWLNVSLTTPVSRCISMYRTTPGALTGIIIFVITCIASILTSMTSLWFNSWKQNRGITPKPVANEQGIDPNQTTKIMSFVFIAFYLIMSYQLPVGMNIYFFLGSMISILQTVIMEAVGAKKRHKAQLATGDGSTLASLRRSKHHQDMKATKKEKKKKGDSDKPFWR